MKEIINQEHDYSRVCAEIENLNSIYATENMAMYSGAIALLGIGWENKSVFLLVLVYAVLISFQLLLNNHLYAIVKRTAYITVFHEVNSSQLTWEFAYHYVEKQPTYYKKNTLSRLGSSVLGMISLISIIFIQFLEISNKNSTILEIGVFLGVSVVCEIILIIINLQVVFKKNIEKKGDQYKELFVYAFIYRNILREINCNKAEKLDDIIKSVIRDVIERYAKYPPLNFVDRLNRDDIYIKMKYKFVN